MGLFVHATSAPQIQHDLTLLHQNQHSTIDMDNQRSQNSRQGGDDKDNRRSQYNRPGGDNRYYQQPSTTPVSYTSYQQMQPRTSGGSTAPRQSTAGGAPPRAPPTYGLPMIHTQPHLTPSSRAAYSSSSVSYAAMPLPQPAWPNTMQYPSSYTASLSSADYRSTPGAWSQGTMATGSSSSNWPMTVPGQVARTREEADAGGDSPSPPGSNPGVGPEESNQTAQDRPHRCKTCGHRFKRKHNLDDHMKTHDPNRALYYCDWEGCTHIGGFNRPRDVERHKDTVRRSWTRQTEIKLTVWYRSIVDSSLYAKTAGSRSLAVTVWEGMF